MSHVAAAFANYPQVAHLRIEDGPGQRLGAASASSCYRRWSSCAMVSKWRGWCGRPTRMLSTRPWRALHDARRFFGTDAAGLNLQAVFRLAVRCPVKWLPPSIPKGAIGA